MDVVRENKTLKQAIGDRDRELVTLGDKLNGIKDQLEKKAKIDEKCRSLERQLKGEIEKSKILRVLAHIMLVRCGALTNATGAKVSGSFDYTFGMLELEEGFWDRVCSNSL